MSCNVRSLKYVELNATRTACQSQQASSEEEDPEVSKDDELVKHEHHPNSAEERRHRQYQAEYHERGLLSRPAAVLIMYHFLEGIADQYMTRAVTTVTRQTTMRELEALFEKHDFNSFPVVEEGKMFRR